MGCDLLALDLVRHWEFLREPPPSQNGTLDLQDNKNAADYRNLLRRRSSLVVADMPVRPGASQATGEGSSAEPSKSKPPPTTFQEPDANSLLDNFGF